ncbi:MAG: pantetheine-phosphate adenylyltransferase [Fimbriimonadales bacterium]|jgi:pantetheine-phosphate adenylyltransferase|nr:pantetheine-phosphate adenylyltransferase [Armatimonadota bacterium]MCX7688790.1 pantetheine-phosphate adenylyltransferase [Fimbriimonadales bacterium]GBC90275.1 Phosphopantetheine adenylyltransferase [bacterium HR14]CUU37059.1 Phosphopantetheine adenylyltransferase [Armatimonadetes bacterium DC]
MAAGAGEVRRAVYPGSFDPPTLGHLDIISRAARLFDELIVAVAVNAQKKPLFTLEERVAMLQECCQHLPNVRVVPLQGLLARFAQSVGACVIVRGLRAVSDFEYEFQMASMNRQLAPEVDTCFLMTHQQYAFLSSSIVKEVARLGGDVSQLVPPNVHARLTQRFAAESAGEATPATNL